MTGNLKQPIRVNHVAHGPGRAPRKRAVDALDGQPASWWLADQAEVLDELGRIDTDDGLRAVAKCLFERRSPAAEALEIIRRHRRIEAFSRYIINAVEAHCERNPGTTALEIRLALESARDALVSLTEPGNPGWHQYLKTLSQTQMGSAKPA